MFTLGTQNVETAQKKMLNGDIIAIFSSELAGGVRSRRWRRAARRAGEGERASATRQHTWGGTVSRGRSGRVMCAPVVEKLPLLMH